MSVRRFALCAWGGRALALFLFFGLLGPLPADAQAQRRLSPAILYLLLDEGLSAPAVLPQVRLSGPGDGAFLAPGVPLRVEAQAAAGGKPIREVAFYAGATLIGSDTGAAGAYGATWTPPGAGAYVLSARVTDSAGGWSVSAPRTVTVNALNTPPTVELTAPENDARYLAPARIALGAQADDVESNTPVEAVEFFRGDTLIGRSTSRPFGLIWEDVPPGVYRLTARAFDRAGASTVSAPRSVTVVAGAAPDGLYFIEVDHLETPRLIADGQGRTVWRWENEDPFGDNPPEEDPDGDGRRFTFNLRFPGQYFDQETGLHQNFFRDYDSATGRYTTSDPIGLWGGVNTYGYAMGNPTRYSDPTGQYVLPIIGLGLGFGLGAAGWWANNPLPSGSNGGYGGGTGSSNAGIIWPPGYDPDPKPPTQCHIGVPPPSLPPPRKPNCETAFQIRRAMCQSAPGFLARATCLAMAAVEYGICKKVFGDHD